MFAKRVFPTCGCGKIIITLDPDDIELTGNSVVAVLKWSNCGGVYTLYPNFGIEGVYPSRVMDATVSGHDGDMAPMKINLTDLHGEELEVTVSKQDIYVAISFALGIQSYMVESVQLAGNVLRRGSSWAEHDIEEDAILQLTLSKTLMPQTEVLGSWIFNRDHGNGPRTLEANLVRVVDNSDY